MEDDLKNKIEALLFASGKFMSDENLALIIGAEKKDVKKAIKALKKDYDEREHSLMITQESNSWKINVREAYLELVRKIVADTELPKSVLQTLAVIAWKSPILQASVVKTRGNKCYEHIAQLEEMGFVTKEPEGRSFNLRVTEKFFEYFDVEGDKDIKEMFKDVRVPEKKEEETIVKETESEKEDVLEEEAEIGEPQEGGPLTPKEAHVLVEVEKEAEVEAEEEELEEEAEDEWEEETEKPEVEVYDEKQESSK